MILVPTDFSKCAKKAADFAVKLSIKTGDKILLLNTYQLKYIDTGFFVDFDDSTAKISKRKLEEEKGRLMAEHHELNGNDILCKSEIGNLSAVVQDIEEEHSVRIILIGTKGRSGFAEVLLGSMAASVLSSCRSPLVVVPELCEIKPYARAAFALELGESITDDEVALIRMLCNGLQSVHLYHNYADVLDVNIEKEHELFGKFKKLFDKEGVYLDLDCEESKVKPIEEYFDDIEAQFIIVRSKHRNLLQQLFHTSVSKRLAFHTKVPMLVLR